MDEYSFMIYSILVIYMLYQVKIMDPLICGEKIQLKIQILLDLQ